jgi:uncharacterized membrane protein YozB (DUF420 family)
LKKGSLPFSRPVGTQYLFSDFIPGNKSPGYCHAPLMGQCHQLSALKLILEIAAAIRVAAIAINLYGVARAFTRRAAEFAAFGRRTAAGWILTDFLILIIRHLGLPPISLNCRLFGAAP